MEFSISKQNYWDGKSVFNGNYKNDMLKGPDFEKFDAK